MKLFFRQGWNYKPCKLQTFLKKFWCRPFIEFRFRFTKGLCCVFIGTIAFALLLKVGMRIVLGNSSIVMLTRVRKITELQTLYVDVCVCVLSAVHLSHSSFPHHNKLEGGGDMSFQELFFLSTMLFPQLPTNDSLSKLQSDYISFTGHSATHCIIIMRAFH